MAVRTYKEMADALHKAGFSGIQIPIMIAIGLAESGGDTSSIGDSGQSYGIWQIYQPVWGNQFNPTCASDLQCSANAAFQISNHGTNFNPWTVFRAAVDPGSLDPSLRANKFTNFLPSVLSYFNVPTSYDWQSGLNTLISGTLSTIDTTINGIISGWGGNTGGGTGGNVIPIISLPDWFKNIPDWAKSALDNIPLSAWASAVAACGIPDIGFGDASQAQWAACIAQAAGSAAIGGIGGIPGIGDIPGVPTFASLQHAIGVLMILGIGMGLTLIGAYGIIMKSDAAKSVKSAAVSAAKDAAMVAA